MCANGCAYKFNREGSETLVSNVVYIPEAWFPEDEHELLNWIRKQRDIIELTETVNASGKKCYVFQFALGDDMVHNYSPFLDDIKLQHNTPKEVPKSFKLKS